MYVCVQAFPVLSGRSHLEEGRPSRSDVFPFSNYHEQLLFLRILVLLSRNLHPPFVFTFFVKGIDVVVVVVVVRTVRNPSATARRAFLER